MEQCWERVEYLATGRLFVSYSEVSSFGEIKGDEFVFRELKESASLMNDIIWESKLANFI